MSSAKGRFTRLGRGGRKGGGGAKGRAQPPQISSNIAFGHLFRFVSGSGSATTVTANSALCAAGTVCSSANNVVASFVGSAKINRVDIWSPPASQGSSVTCSVNWAGSGNSANREVSDTSISTAMPAHVSTRPPERSLAAFWFNANTPAAPLFTVVAPTGSIIDVSMSLILFDEDTNDAQAAVVVATGVQGLVYYMSLDPNSTHHYTPVSLTTTT